MKRSVLFGLVGLVIFAAACNKPSEDSCRKALSNMRTLLGTDNSNAELEGAVRSCKGGSSKAAVECAIKATTVQELKACDFMKVPDRKAPAGGGSAGSAAPAGSAAGSAAPAAP